MPRTPRGYAPGDTTGFVPPGGDDEHTGPPGRRVSTRLPDLEGEDPARVEALRAHGGPRSTLRRLAPRGAGADEEADDARYRPRDEVGRGGMGRIVRAEDADLNREIAMKVLLDRVGSESDAFRRFVAEAQITSQLEHPGVVPVHDFGLNAEGELFFTMQYVRSHRNLEDIVEDLRAGDRAAFARYTFEQRVQIVQKVCQALQYAHERGVVHRDIKPTNIMVGDHGEVYLVDWGVAKLLDVPEDADRARPSTLREDEGADGATGEGWLGTPAYMAPEQVLGYNADVDATSDLYTLTAVLYELLSLHYYLGDVRGGAGALAGAIVHKAPPDAESHWHDVQGRVPRSLSRICRQGLSKRKEQRFQSALELERTLQRWLEGNAPMVCPGTTMQRLVSRFSAAIDRHPVATPALTLVAVGLALAWLVTATVLLALR